MKMLKMAKKSPAFLQNVQICQLLFLKPGEEEGER